MTNLTGASTTNAVDSPVMRKVPVSPSGSYSGDSPISRPYDLSASDEDNTLFGGHPSHHHHMPSSVPKSVPSFMLEVPTFPETFASTHLRRLFYGSYLEVRLGDDEKAVWDALCKFHADFACLTDAEVTARQKDIIDAASKLLEKFPDLPNHDALVTALKDHHYTVSSRFFFDAESKLYGISMPVISRSWLITNGLFIRQNIFTFFFF